jgi:hypothetical protein
MNSLAVRTALVLSLSGLAQAVTRYEDEESCRLVGDPDIYGIGVRVGYYFAWFAGIIALLTKNPRASSDNVKATVILSLSIWIILVMNTTRGSLASFEWYLVSQIQFLMLGSVANQVVYNPSWATIGSVLGVVLLYWGIQPWPHFSLANQGRREDCELYGFVFAPFDFYSTGFQIFMRITSITFVIVAARTIPTAIRLIIHGLGQKRKDGEATPMPIHHSHSRKTEDDQEAQPGQQPEQGLRRRRRNGPIRMLVRWIKSKRGGERPEGENASDFLGIRKFRNSVMGGRTGGSVLMSLLGLAPLTHVASASSEDKEARTGSIYIGVISLVFGVIGIAFTEKLIIVNDIDLSEADLSNSSQLVPFLIGLFSLISCLWQIIHDYIDPE